MADAANSIESRAIRDRNRRKAGISGRTTMGVISWIVVGLIAGFIGSKIVNKTGEGLIRDIILGVIGAFVGGWIFTALGVSGVTGVNIYSIFVAVVGAVVVLLAYHAIFGQGATA
jgi:uncharacterized membrane protein YeaQ/YmgE (transglycosylase-associated protein family)